MASSSRLSIRLPVTMTGGERGARSSADHRCRQSDEPIELKRGCASSQNPANSEGLASEGLGLLTRGSTLLATISGADADSVLCWG